MRGQRTQGLTLLITGRIIVPKAAAKRSTSANAQAVKVATNLVVSTHKHDGQQCIKTRHHPSCSSQPGVWIQCLPNYEIYKTIPGVGDVYVRDGWLCTHFNISATA